MRSMFFVMISLIVLGCSSQNDKDFKKGAYTSKEKQSLHDDHEKFEKLKFEEATKQFGEPSETRKIKIDDETVHSFLSDELIQKYFSKKEYLKKDTYMIEASWKRLSESWITVWYIYEKEIWKPIQTLVTI
ncbi:hypothetical protein [Aquimarina sp. I32.4]|uniref:hypothetical protein n=1 Tax=Aquimarina sp. I32.4 TaxID=2053903 RepID=UPI0011AEF75A|nr:hypothetical protein [Aquimarina sp. I32.4]